MKDQKDGGNLFGYLRHKAKPYRKRYGKQDYRGWIPGRVDIGLRPAIVDEKVRLGDWEADTVIGKGHQDVFVTLTGRVSKLNWRCVYPTKKRRWSKMRSFQLYSP